MATIPSSHTALPLPLWIWHMLLGILILLFRTRSRWEILGCFTSRKWEFGHPRNLASLLCHPTNGIRCFAATKRYHHARMHFWSIYWCYLVSIPKLPLTSVRHLVLHMFNRPQVSSFVFLPVSYLFCPSSGFFIHFSSGFTFFLAAIMFYSFIFHPCVFWFFSLPALTFLLPNSLRAPPYI